MRRFLIAVLAMAGLALPSAAMASGPTAADPMTSGPDTSRPAAPADTFEQDAEGFDAAMAKNDCVAGLPFGRRLIASPRFEPLPDNVKLAVWSATAACAVNQHLVEEAFADARHATRFQTADDWLWIFRIQAGVDLDRPDDVAEAVEMLGIVRPATLNAVPVRTFYDFQRQQEHRPPDALRRVLAALEKADYKPKAVLESADWLWLASARMALDAGDTEHAGALVRRITSVKRLIQIRLDARFSAIVAADPARYDLKAAADRGLAKDRAVMDAHAELLQAVHETVTDLRALGRFDEALALAQPPLDRAARAPKGKPAFTDQAQHLNWITDDKGYILLEVGRVDEALAVERAAAALGEEGGKNVSQTINLAGFLNVADKPAEALKVLTPFDKSLTASPYGFAWVHAERACADEGLGRAADLAVELAWLAAHQTDNPSARLKALLCVGDLDGAAASVTADLQDPARRDNALIILCDFDVRPHHTARAALLASRLAAVAARPDVRAAIARVGRTEHIPLNGDPFVDVF